MSGRLVFDSLLPREEHFDADGRRFILREATEDAAMKIRAVADRATRTSPDGKTVEVIDAAASAENALYMVSLCLWEVTKDGEKQVTPDEMRHWPARVTKALAEKVIEMSELGERDTPESLDEKIARLREQREKLLADGGASPEKNGHKATTGTSA